MRRQTHHNLKLVFKVAALFALSISLPSAASTGPSWSQQPAWASGPSDEGRAERRPVFSRERFNIAPFTPGSNNLALDVGQVFLMGNLGNRYSDSIGSQLHYTYGVSDLFGFDSSFGYSEHSDGKFSMMTLLTGLRTNLSWYDKVIPYLVFGLGFYRPSYSSVTNDKDQVINLSMSPLLFGVHFGPGVDLELTRQLFFGASLTFHDIFGGSTKLDPTGDLVNLGGSYTTFLLHAGVTF